MRDRAALKPGGGKGVAEEKVSDTVLIAAEEKVSDTVLID